MGLDWKNILSSILASVSFMMTLIVVCCAAYLAFINVEIQKKRKRNDLYRLLKAEFTNLGRHCRMVHAEIEYYGKNDIAQIKTAKYKDGSMFLFDVKEAYLLNENLCQDIMQLSLLSRNNDIFVEDLLERMKIDSFQEDDFNKYLGNIRQRMGMTTNLCAQVLDNLDRFVKDPKIYSEPAINW